MRVKTTRRRVLALALCVLLLLSLCSLSALAQEPETAPEEIRSEEPGSNPDPDPDPDPNPDPDPDPDGDARPDPDAEPHARLSHDARPERSGAAERAGGLCAAGHGLHRGLSAQETQLNPNKKAGSVFASCFVLSDRERASLAAFSRIGKAGRLCRFFYSGRISQAMPPLSKTVTSPQLSVRPFPAVPGFRTCTPPISRFAASCVCPQSASFAPASCAA